MNRSIRSSCLALAAGLALAAAASRPALAAAKPSVKAAPSTAAAQSNSAAVPEAGPGAKININSASQEQLESLPGVGPSLALRILDYRKQNGPFKAVDDLLNVKGVGEKSFEKIRPFITVSTDK